MKEKYIRKGKKYYTIVKSGKIFGKYLSEDYAIFARDYLVSNDWDLNNISQFVVLINDFYSVVCVVDEKLCILGSFEESPTKYEIQEVINNYRRNPNNSRYGLNIVNEFGVYIIRKQIFNDVYTFGVYDNLPDATFVRNLLLDNDWSVDKIEGIMFDDVEGNYGIIKVIDDKACVLKRFDNINSAFDGNHEAYNEFVIKIYKNKKRLASYPHLDCFRDIADELYSEIEDDGSILNVISNYEGNNLSEVLFNLTPWQKLIYDGINDEITFDKLLDNLKGYKSKNFEKKVDKYLNELIDLNLIKKENGVYKKV